MKVFPKKAPIAESQFAPAVQAFLEGRSNTLTSEDIDPQNAEAFARYEYAMGLKTSGDLPGAAALLEQSCSPPSIYKGHYRELFKIWRQMNRNDRVAANHAEVVARVRRMVRLDNELISEMLFHWGAIQGRQLPPTYFDNDRNLLQSDIKALLQAGTAVQDSQSVALAQELLQRFVRKSVA